MHWIRSTYTNRSIYIYIKVLNRLMCIHLYYNLYSYRRIWVLYTTPRLGKYLKVHSRSGTRMSNDDHLLVPGTRYPGTRREYRTGLSVHPWKYYMFIQCGRRGFARPRKPGQSNRGMQFTFINHIIYVEAGTYNGFFGQEILGLKFRHTTTIPMMTFRHLIILIPIFWRP